METLSNVHGSERRVKCKVAPFVDITNEESLGGGGPSAKAEGGFVPSRLSLQSTLTAHRVPSPDSCAAPKERNPHKVHLCTGLEPLYTPANYRLSLPKLIAPLELPRARCFHPLSCAEAPPCAVTIVATI